ncbi:hypothetical protein DZG00_02035 [Clavibacter lycopersici]|uniref:Uncharacterized protein n=1 Tax=Clavibacter lycopersici TaxID=2301718 RepID=A0A399TEL8_9MICO|nr:hypothetical protein [Clavibacter lycopersici]RIJ53165.1 hypothetical protein DZG00_02035 [Clavibacter lycopersici]RIJ59810.1 hypothetical protein DZG02_11155 [Clavibacter lycopersici]
MNTADPTLDTRIQAFAAAVRARLSDLDPEDVDDLTGGLEADLQEEAADHDGALELGDPARYADELRTSAGLPERVAGAATTSPVALLRQRIEETGRQTLSTVRANRELSAILDLLITFRPVWWLLRAWAGYQCAVLVLTVLFGGVGGFELIPGGPIGWLLLIGITAISVQWGRGRWAPTPIWRTTRAVVSAATALALLALIPLAITTGTEAGYVDESSYGTSYEQPGLSLDGKQVTNLFAYDAEGDLLDRVQLFDQDGEPLTTIGSSATGGTVSDPATGEPVSPADGAWNVFPLGGSDAALVTGTIDGSEAVVRPPFAKALPLDPDPEATSSPSPTGTPDASPPAEAPAPEPAPTEEPTP